MNILCSLSCNVKACNTCTILFHCENYQKKYKFTLCLDKFSLLPFFFFFFFTCSIFTFFVSKPKSEAWSKIFLLRQVHYYFLILTKLLTMNQFHVACHWDKAFIQANNISYNCDKTLILFFICQFTDAELNFYKKQYTNRTIIDHLNIFKIDI